MTLVLAIETAAPAPVVALGDESGVLFEDAPRGRVEGPVWLRRAVREAVAGRGLALGEIDAVAVDRGPGGLTATRGGVTFANALAYGLGRPLVALGYFDLVGRQSWDGTGPPVACVRPTTAGEAFLALFGADGLGPLWFGDLGTLAAMAKAERADVAAAGVVTPAVAALFGRRPAGASVPSARALVDRALALVAAGAGAADPLEPLTSASPAVTRIGTGVDREDG